MPRAVVLPPGTDAAGLRLLNDWQRGFPLQSRPFAAIAEAVASSEDDVLAAYRAWHASGVVSRIGAVFAPGRLGAGALVALAVPPGRLTEVAARVNAEPGVNHNYEREHRFNLWFVIGARDEDDLERAVGNIERETGCQAIRLPLLEEYHIDLGFDLTGVATKPRPGAAPDARRFADVCGALSSATESEPAACERPAAGPACAGDPPRVTRATMTALDRIVLGALQEGLPLLAQPFVELGRRVGLDERAVIEVIENALGQGLIRRFGVVVRHHELGIGANAMCVWDVPDQQVGDIGRRLAREPVVTLCYRRPRVLPYWPYNLFCMIHGSDREAVLAAREDIAGRLGLDRWARAVLFSGRRFRQRGARYLPDNERTSHAESARA